MAMGKMKISIDAEVEGKRLEFSFTWDGDDNAIGKVSRFIEWLADQEGVTPEALTQAVLRHLPATGVMDDPGRREVQKMAILYMILQLPTRDSDRPGAIYNYAGREDIKAQLQVRDKEVTASIEGRPLPH
jgi:hypothetical protein